MGLILIRKCKDVDEKIKHQIDLDVSAFGRELHSKLVVPFKAICNSLYLEGHNLFIKTAYRDIGIDDVLESQEISLMKLDFIDQEEYK